MLEFAARERETSILQPMGFAEILDTTFSLYRKHFRLFLRIIAFYFGLSLLNEFLFADSLFLTLVISCVITTAVGGALSAASSTVYLGEHTTAQAGWRYVRKAVLSYFGCSFLWGFIAFTSFVCIIGLFMLFLDERVRGFRVNTISFLLCVFPGALYFTISWMFWAFAILIEEKSVRRALKRSKQLVQGTWWRVCGIAFAIVLLSTTIDVILETSLVIVLELTTFTKVEHLPKTIQQSFQGAFFSDYDLRIRTETLRALISFVTDTFTLPIWVIGSMLLYFDLRVRKEAFDLEMMITHYGGEHVD